MMMAKGITVTLIDSKPSQIELAGNFGAKVYYGDGMRLDLLRIAGAADAKALLFCIDGNDRCPRASSSRSSRLSRRRRCSSAPSTGCI